MAIETMEERAFLSKLYTMTEGDQEAQVSMYDVGEQLGIEKDAAGSLAENLFIQGLAELKTLSGGIGITVEGMKELDVKIPLSSAAMQVTLGTDRILDDAGRQTTLSLLEDIKALISTRKESYPRIEALVIDIKTIEIQLLSPSPGTAVIKEIFRSIHQNISQNGTEEIVEKLGHLMEN